MELAVKDKLTEKFSKTKVDKILDVATGAGQFIGRLIKSFDYNQIIGIDSEEKPLEHARKLMAEHKIPNVKFMKMSVENLEFEDEYFDVVCISNSLHHLENLEASLEEMKRVLAPGGYFIITEMYSDNQNKFQQSHVELHHWCGEIDTKFGIIHNKTYTKQELINIAKGINLQNYEIMDQVWEIEDPKDEKILVNLGKAIDNYLEKAKELPDYESIKEKGENLRKRVFDVGYQSAKQVIIIGEK